MPDAQPAAAGGNADNPQQPAAGGLNNAITFFVRLAVFWYLLRWFQGGSGKAPAGAPSKGAAGPLFAKSTPFDVYTYINEQEGVSTFESWQPIWIEENVGLADEINRTMRYTYSPSEAVKNNGSVYLHMLFARHGMTVDEELAIREGSGHFWRTHSLNTYLPKRKETEAVSLLSANKTDKSAAAVEPTKQREIISYWKPNMTIAMVDHFQAYPSPRAIPSQIQPAFSFDVKGRYYPLIHFNEFWVLRDYLVPLNDTVDSVAIDLHLSHESFWWWQLQLQMDQSFNMQVSTGLSSDGDSDEFKRVLIEGNPYLLGLTFFVSLLHTVFDMLAFKNDIGFWKNNKSMEGLSARSIVINAFCQLVILLYLIDNETSFVVLLSSGLGCAIEFWKVTKAMDVSFDSKTFPYLIVKDRASYSQKKTKQYDAEASRYLSYALYPLIFCYSIYSLYYQKHKSWYSWVLGTLVGSVYAFGFILMCPQLYLNYKLKSVAHLPWRQMTYKFLNTIIDDLFAFVIKMPLLHRLSVFRDDVIFLIYLYQRWIYRVDKTRANEFGWAEEQAGEDEAVPAVEGAAAEGALTDGAEPAVAAGEGSEAPARRRKKGGDAKAAAGAAGDQAAATEEKKGK